MRVLVGVVLALSAGCAPSASTPSCDDELCASGVTVTIAPERGEAIAPGLYELELRFDALRTNEECIVAAPPATTQCNGGLVTLLHDNLATTGFLVKGPAAAQVSIVVRAACIDAPLVSKTFAPTYACATGCRAAEARVALPSAGFTICDAGTD